MTVCQRARTNRGRRGTPAGGWDPWGDAEIEGRKRTKMEREFLRAREESVLALPVLVRGEKVCNGKGSWRDFLLVSLFFIFSLLRLKKGKPPTWAHADIRRKYSTPRSFSFHLRQGFFTGTILLIFSCFSFTSLSLISLFFPAIGMACERKRFKMISKEQIRARRWLPSILRPHFLPRSRPPLVLQTCFAFA